MTVPCRRTGFVPAVFVLAGLLAAGVAGCATDSQASSPSEVHSHDGVAPHSHAAQAFHRPAGTGKAYFGPGDLYTFLATGEETNQAYFQFEAIVPPGGGPPPHVHRGEDESFYLAEGTLEMQLGPKIITVNAGDFVNVPRGTPHRFKNISDKPAKMIVTFVPAGMERFFEAVFPLAEDRTATPPPVTDELIRRMNEEAPRHRIEFVPPPATQPKP